MVNEEVRQVWPGHSIDGDQEGGAEACSEGWKMSTLLKTDSVVLCVIYQDDNMEPLRNIKKK